MCACVCVCSESICLCNGPWADYPLLSLTHSHIYVHRESTWTPNSRVIGHSVEILPCKARWANARGIQIQCTAWTHACIQVNCVDKPTHFNLRSGICLAVSAPPITAVYPVEANCSNATTCYKAFIYFRFIKDPWVLPAGISLNWLNERQSLAQSDPTGP